MVYITLEELKKILPGILDRWIDEDDESWEWIFQEIEQKCHIGKQKTKKKKLVSMVDTHSTILSAHFNGINELNKKYDELSNKISRLSDKYISMVSRVNNMSSDVNAAKSMAETAKQRTEVDYSKYSGKSDGEKMCKTCKYSSNIDGSPKSFDAPPCDSCNHNNKWEAKDE